MPAGVAAGGCVRPATASPSAPSGTVAAGTGNPITCRKLLREHLNVDGDGLVPSMGTTEVWGWGRKRVAPGVWLP